MDALHEMLYEELRQTEQEVLQSLQKKDANHRLKSILEAELDDIQSAIKKVNNGSYGLCEFSGDLIPEELLKIVPTIKSIEDLGNFKTFYRKPLYF
ncbi:MAG: TraR/DksA C4-type zinc finger protein [Bacillota bacterium]|jgi:RNA polymerase-binding transcription factor DksA|nr:TraR/DksA C4-type zinc finger protein [Bacillota bacterium]MDP4154408.1 TraR/DksA C4-type zinc finger protein [Bacillota bacterium]